MKFKIVKIDNVVYKKFFNLLVYESIRENLFKKNKMLILYLLNKRSKLIVVK